MPVTLANYDDVIFYHKPSDEEVARIQNVRVGIRAAVKAILENVPVCADQQAAIRHVTDGLMTANRGIVLKGIV